MKNYAARLTVIMFLCASIFIVPQERHKSEANADIVEYTNQDGLPSNNFSNIIQTKDGYIWLSGVEGTYRFDGYEFEEVGKKYGVPQMQNIYYDTTKNILYFASPQKFISFDGKKFKVYGEKDGYKINGLPGQVVQLLKADSKGRIWIGSETPFVDKKYNGGLTMFQNGKFTVFDSAQFPLDNARDFIETPYGDLIFLSDGHNTQTREGSYIALFKNGKFTRVDESLGVNIQGAGLFRGAYGSAVDENGNTWIVCSGIFSSGNIEGSMGVLMYDGTSFHQYTDFIKEFVQSQFPLQIYFSKKLGKLFLTTAYAVKGKLFSKNEKTIFELDNGKFKPSDIFKKIGKITNLKTNSTINDFLSGGCFFKSADKYFPETLILSSTNNSTQSSKYPNQFFTFKDNTWSKYEALSGVPISEIKNGEILTSSKGFSIYYPNHSEMLTAKEGLIQSQGGILVIYTDKRGNVWISYSYTDIPAYATTFNIGMNVWDGKKLRTLTTKDGLPSNTTFNVFEDSFGRTWIPTSKGLAFARVILNSSGTQIFKISRVNTSGGDYNVTNVLETKSRDLYAWQNYIRPSSADVAAAKFYLAKYNGKKFVRINSPFDNSDMAKKYQTYDLKEDRQGRLWLFGIFSNDLKDITTERTKIRIFDGKTWSKPPASWGVPGDQLHYVGVLDNGMYFLTVGGFYVFNGKRFVNLSDSVNANADFRILRGASVAGTMTNIEANNRLYIRLRGRGLVIFDGTNLKFYTKKDGLPSTNLSNPTIDYKGNVVFSNPTGAFEVTGDQFQTFPDDENVVSGGPYVSIKDGYKNLLEFYNGVGLYIRKIDQKKYPMKISSVWINDKPSYYTYPSDLPFSRNSFTFNFSALNYKSPDQTNYEHYLKGYDKGWSRPSDLAFAEYQNLPAGKYNFEVRGITSNGNKTDIASFAFVVNPPLWRTWWAYSLYLIIVGLGLVGIRRYERGKIIRREEGRLKEERAAAALKEAKLRAQIAEAESERKSKELEEARKLQLSMLPKEIPQLPHLDIAVYMKTATEVGGDYYDFHLHPDGTLTVILGDATGHGMRSGMMVSIMKSLFMSDRTNKQLKPFFENASAAIKDMQLGRLMMSLACVQINSDRIVVANAGMPPLIIYRHKQQTVEEVSLNNMPLGAMRQIQYDTTDITVDKGDTLLMMSDGFAELKNDKEELYGYRRARSIFEKVARQEPEKIVNHLKEAGMKWTSNEDPEDDVTFVVIKVK